MSASVEKLSLRRRIAGQGALLLSGSLAAQLLGLARNALLAYGLSKGHFGTAAAILIALQLIESMMELPIERFIVQADDGADARVIANGHTLILLRGFAAGILLYLASGWIAAFFAIAEQGHVFAAMAIVPVIKGLQNLDQRRQQRRLDNRASLAVELVPQLVALFLTWPLLRIVGDFTAVVWLSIAQALTLVAMSHLVSRQRYGLGFDRGVFMRQAAFGLPFLASAWPHAATYYGERAIIGRWLGLETLAGYSVAFLLTSAAGLVVARIGQALVLPLLSSAKTDAATFTRRFVGMLELHVIAAAVLVAVTIAGGNGVMRIVFGKPYWAFGGVLGWLSVLCAIRIVQSVPSLALMAMGNTAIFFWATLMRAAALAPILYAAMHGASIETIVAIAIAGELASLGIYLTALRSNPGALRACLTRGPWLIAVAALAVALPAMPNTLADLAMAAALGGVTAITGVLIMPETRAVLLAKSVSWLDQTRPAPQSP